jgi:hypothetical protein
MCRNTATKTAMLNVDLGLALIQLGRTAPGMNTDAKKLKANATTTPSSKTPYKPKSKVSISTLFTLEKLSSVFQKYSICLSVGLIPATYVVCI